MLGDWCTALALSPDGKLLAAAELGRPTSRIRFGDAEKYTPLKRAPLEFDTPVVSMGFSFDGQTIVTTNGNSNGYQISDAENQKICLWKAGDGALVRELKGHPRAVSVAAFFADGQRLFSASPFDGTLRVWNVNVNDKASFGDETKKIEVADETPPPTLRTKGGSGVPSASVDQQQPHQMTCCAFWPWGRALVGHRYGGLSLWDLNMNTDKPLREWPKPSEQNVHPVAVAISPDGHHAVAAYGDGNVYLYRLPPP
jgi:WD40 repeat protein